MFNLGAGGAAMILKRDHMENICWNQILLQMVLFLKMSLCRLAEQKTFDARRLTKWTYIGLMFWIQLE